MTEIQSDTIPRAARVAHAAISRAHPLLIQAVAALGKLTANDLANLISEQGETVEFVITVCTSHGGAHVSGVLRGTQGGQTLTLMERTA